MIIRITNIIKIIEIIRIIKICKIPEILVILKIHKILKILWRSGDITLCCGRSYTNKVSLAGYSSFADL